jgi:hypothetical protein
MKVLLMRVHILVTIVMLKVPSLLSHVIAVILKIIILMTQASWKRTYSKTITAWF